MTAVRLRRPLLVAAAAALYVVSAWSVAPGFYDGFTPATPYRFVNPPPQARAANLPPLSGSATIKVVKGVLEPGSAFTQDAQAQLGFTAGAFEPPPNGAAVTIEIKPVATYPPPPSTFTLVTNVYLITANAKLTMPANLALTYSDQVPQPSNIYMADSAGHWHSIAANQSPSVFVISARVSQLGSFAAGYDNIASGSGSATRIGGGSQWLPIVVAVAILLVILAGIPLAVLRRRGGGGAETPTGSREASEAGGATPKARPPRHRPRRRT